MEALIPDVEIKQEVTEEAEHEWPTEENFSYNPSAIYLNGCNMDSTSDSDQSFHAYDGVTDKNLQFVLLLRQHKVILDKSQVPSVKAEKDASVASLCALYKQQFSETLSSKQMLKKINNMKSEIKRKLEINRTGNRHIVYKPWEVCMLDLMQSHCKPTFNAIQGSVSDYVFENPDDDCESNSTPNVNTTTTRKRPTLTETPVPKKRTKVTAGSTAETDETKELSNNELQRLVLLEQLALIRLQQQEIKERLSSRKFVVQEEKSN